MTMISTHFKPWIPDKPASKGATAYHDAVVKSSWLKDKTDVEIVGSAEEAYKQAGITPNDINIAEIHDAFTSVELISYEDLGFCKKGDAKEMIRKGVTNINGKLPVNTSGGLKAKGHPISATGISQIYELVKQMRNEAGDRQVADIKYGLAQNIGGAGSTVAVHILGKVD